MTIKRIARSVYKRRNYRPRSGVTHYPWIARCNLPRLYNQRARLIVILDKLRGSGHVHADAHTQTMKVTERISSDQWRIFGILKYEFVNLKKNEKIPYISRGCRRNRKLDTVNWSVSDQNSVCTTASNLVLFFLLRWRAERVSTAR